MLTARKMNRGFRAGFFVELLMLGSLVACAEPSRPPTPGSSGIQAMRTAALPSAARWPGGSTVGQTQTLEVSALPPSAPKRGINASSLPAEETPKPAASTAESTNTAPFEAFRSALTDKNFAAAKRWLAQNTVHLDHNVDALANSVVLLGLNQPDSALDLLQAADFGETLPTAWVKDLRVQSYARSDKYLSYLGTLRRADNFSSTLEVASRLLRDAQLVDCEVFVNRALGLADHFEARGQARFLRAQLRLAQNLPSQAASDLRWLALSNPHHSASERAFGLLSEPPFASLTSADQYLRANQLADHGLVAATDTATDTLRPLLQDKPAIADLDYLRGLARYRQRLFAEAVPPLDRAVQTGSHKADHARYLAARATARAGNPQAAIERFKVIARSKPATKTVSNAAFHIAREYSIAGNWDEAAVAYGAFQARFPSHEYAKLVEQDLLPVWFAAGHYKRVVYWARRLREKDPERADASLLRSVEALALSRLGHTDLAKQVWQGLAQTSPLSFAGVVARQRLKALGTDLKPPFADNAEQYVRLDVPLPQLVTQLDALGFSRQAEYMLRRQEASLVRAFAPNGDAALCDAYAPLRGGRRRYELGYEAVKRRGFRDSPQLAEPWLWHCYYPTPFLDSVTRHAKTHPVSQALVYAVMRQESAFIQAVESNAGARGLMQIIDPTARRIAAELNRSYNLDDLDKPDLNIEFGVFYLNKLQNYFAHPALVAAAYNAGPEATARWFAAGRALPLEVFVLRIPYEETRTYVQRVLANLAVYQALSPQFPRVNVSLEFAQALDPNQTLPDVLHATPEDFY